jgi:branched-chain amino acid transport system permease protein
LRKNIINGIKGEDSREKMDITIWFMAITYAAELTLLCIGYTLTYVTAKIPNFAHGTYAGFGIYVSYTFAKFFGINPYLGFPLAFVIGGVISVVVFKLVISTLTKMGSGSIVLTIATLAIQIFLGAILYIYAYAFISFFKQYATAFLLKEYDFKIGDVSGIFFVSIGISVVTVLILHYLLTRTKMGIAMRATAEDTELASVLGINIVNVQLFSWFLTGGLACLAGAMIPFWFQSSPATGSAIITSIMAGSLLGGFDNIYGAIIGGFTIGMAEIMLTLGGQIVVGNWFGEYRPLIPMFFLIAILLIEPRGIAGIYERLGGRRIRATIKKPEEKEDEK